MIRFNFIGSWSGDAPGSVCARSGRRIAACVQRVVIFLIGFGWRYASPPRPAEAPPAPTPTRIIADGPGWSGRRVVGIAGPGRLVPPGIPSGVGIVGVVVVAGIPGCGG